MATKCWQHLFISQRSIRSKVSIAYQQKRKSRKNSKKRKIPKAFINYSQATNDVYEILEGYNPTKKRKVLIAEKTKN